MVYSHLMYPSCHGSRGGRRAQKFLMSGGQSGYAALPHDITINSVTKSPTYRYEAHNADATQWAATVGTDVPIHGATGDLPVIDEYAPGLTDSRVGFQISGKKYHLAGSTYGDVGTDDMVFEMVLKMPLVTQYMFAKTNVNSTNQYGVLCLNGTAIYWTYGGEIIGISVVPGQWIHLIAFVDKSGSMVIYRNAVQGAVFDVSLLTGSGDGGTFTIGSQTAALTPQDGSLAYFSMWQGAGWLDTHLQEDVAKERFYRACGIWPEIAAGTAMPEIATRSTAAYLDRLDDDGDRIIVPVGVNWLRVCERMSGGIEAAGVLLEGARTNGFTYSQDFENAAWDKTRAAISAAAKVAPDGTLTGAGVIGNTQSGTHYIGQSIGSAAGQDLFDVWLAPGAKTWARLVTSNVANGDAYFDLANCAVGTVGAGCTAGIEQWADGWCRCWIVYTSGVSAHNHDIVACVGDESDSYTGDDETIDIYVWGAQHEKSTRDAPASYVLTTTAAATYTADTLRYPASDNIGGADNGEGTMQISTIGQGYDHVDDYVLAQLNDGGSADNAITLGVDADDKATLTVVAGGVSQAAITSTTEIGDGSQHCVRASWTTDSVTLRVDGVVEGTDTSATIPTGLDRLQVGSDESGAKQPWSLVSCLRTWEDPLS